MATDSTQELPKVVSCFSNAIYFPTGIKLIAAQTMLVILDIVISFFGTLANGLVIMAYYRNPRLRTIQNTIFLLLAITDICVTAFVQPIYVAASLRGFFRENDCLLWDISMNLMTLFVFLSLVTIVILSLQSYITLAFPYRFQSILNKHRLIVMVVFSWGFVTTPTLIFVIYPSLKIHIYFGVFTISSTIVTVVLTWIWTYKLVARHRKAIQTAQAPSTLEIVSRKKILRSTFTAFAVVLSLLGCYLFGLCFIFFTILLDAWDINHDTHLIMSSATATLMFLNSLLNPCLVFWRSSEFRETVRNIFSRRPILQQ